MKYLGEKTKPVPRLDFPGTCPTASPHDCSTPE